MVAVARSTSAKPARPSGRGSRTPAAHGAAGRPHLWVVPPIRHPRRYLALLFVVAALGVFGVVSLNALAAESAFESRALEHEVAELTVRYDELTAEVATLEAPQRVQQVATRDLGMVPAQQPGFIVLDRNDSLGKVALRDDPDVPALGR